MTKPKKTIGVDLAENGDESVACQMEASESGNSYKLVKLYTLSTEDVNNIRKIREELYRANSMEAHIGNLKRFRRAFASMNMSKDEIIKYNSKFICNKCKYYRGGWRCERRFNISRFNDGLFHPAIHEVGCDFEEKGK